MDAEFKAIMNQTIPWEKYLNKNSEGDLVYEDPVNLKGYVAGKQKLFSSVDSNIVTKGTIIYIDPNNQLEGINVLEIGTNDKLTPPNGVARVVESTDEFYDLENENGFYLLEVVVK